MDLNLAFVQPATHDELILMYRMRYNIYCLELGTENALLLSENMETDAYDEQAEYFLAEDGDRVVGAMRLIKPSELGFPMEKVFRLPAHIDRSRCLEASRASVVPAYRGQGIMKKLVAMAARWSVANGYCWWCVAILEHLRPAGLFGKWDFEQIGPSAPYHGTIALPLVFKL